MRPRSRRVIRPSFALNFRLLKNRGRRECRAPAAPAASHANESEHTSVVTTVTPETPGIPYTVVLTAYIALSPVTGLFCHRRRRSCLRQLDASVGASGPHDFAVRSSAARLASPPRPPHPAPNVRDDRATPLERRRDRIDIFLFLPRGQAKFRKIRNIQALLERSKLMLR